MRRRAAGGGFHASAIWKRDRVGFAAAGLTPQPSEKVAAPRARECPLQLEATVSGIRPIGDGTVAAVEVVRVHAAPEIVVEGTHHVDPVRWTPLLYVFRHYVAAGERLGKSFRAEV